MNKNEKLREELRQISNVEVLSATEEEISYNIPTNDDELTINDVNKSGTMDTKTMLEYALILTNTHGMLEYIDKHFDRFDPDNTRISIDTKLVRNIMDLKVDSVTDKEIAYTLPDGSNGSLAPRVVAERALMYLCTPSLLEKVNKKLIESTPGQMGE